MADNVDPRYGADGRTYAEVIAARDRFQDDEQKIGSSFDKHLLTLASGALAVSIGFVEKIATNPEWTILLFLAWSMFAGCILTNLLAILVSQESINRHALLNKMSYELGPGKYDDSNRYPTWVERLNWTALVLFVLGVILIVAFSITNQKGYLMSKQTTSSVPVQKSAGGHALIIPAPQSSTSGTAGQTPASSAGSSTTQTSSGSGSSSTAKP